MTKEGLSVETAPLCRIKQKKGAESSIAHIDESASPQSHHKVIRAGHVGALRGEFRCLRTYNLEKYSQNSHFLHSKIGKKRKNNNICSVNHALYKAVYL